MPGPSTMVTVTGTGATSYPASGAGNLRAKFPLDQLATLGGLGPRKGFLRELTIRCSFVLTENGTADTTLDWEKAYDALERIVFAIQGHEFVNLLNKGGTALRVWHECENGTLPEMATNVTIAKGKTATVNLVLPIKCYDERSVSPEDDLIPLGLLNGGTLDVDWTSAGQAVEFGATLVITSGTISVSAEIMERDETRYPALWRIEQYDMQSKNDQISPAKVLYTDMVIAPVHPAGIAAGTLSSTEIASLTLTQNTRKVIDAQTLSMILSRFNMTQTKESGVNQTDPADFVPLVFNPRSSGKRTHFEPDYSKPKIDVTGTVTTSDLRILLRYVFPSGPRTVAALASKAGDKLPEDFARNSKSYLAGKTVSKVLATTGAKEAFLAQKLYRGGVPGRTAQG